MNDILIEVESGKSVRCKTANKVCRNDIVVTAKGENITKYMNAFDDMFENVEFPIGYEMVIELGSAGSYTFSTAFDQAKNIRKITIKSDYDNTKKFNFYRAFRAHELEILDLSGVDWQVTDFRETFAWAASLREIIGVITIAEDYGLTLPNLFAGCAALEEVRFAPLCIPVNIQFNNSPNLTDESIQSIIDGLKDLTDSTTQTITFHKDIKAKLTETQIATITSKNWTLA